MITTGRMLRTYILPQLHLQPQSRRPKKAFDIINSTVDNIVPFSVQYFEYFPKSSANVPYRQSNIHGCPTIDSGSY